MFYISIWSVRAASLFLLAVMPVLFALEFDELLFGVLDELIGSRLLDARKLEVRFLWRLNFLAQLRIKVWIWTSVRLVVIEFERLGRWTSILFTARHDISPVVGGASERCAHEYHY